MSASCWCWKDQLSRRRILRSVLSSDWRTQSENAWNNISQTDKTTLVCIIIFSRISIKMNKAQSCLSSCILFQTLLWFCQQEMRTTLRFFVLNFCPSAIKQKCATLTYIKHLPLTSVFSLYFSAFIKRIKILTLHVLILNFFTFLSHYTHSAVVKVFEFVCGRINEWQKIVD